MMKRIKRGLELLQKFSDRSWYLPAVGFLAAIDNLVMVIPTDGILVSSTMLRPHRWPLIAVTISVGSTVGALVLAAMVEYHGLPWVLSVYPGLDETKTWLWTVEFLDKAGLALVFFVALTPLPQQPTVILASLASTPLGVLAAVVFGGRFVKYLAMAYLASHAPGVLKKYSKFLDIG